MKKLFVTLCVMMSFIISTNTFAQSCDDAVKFIEDDALKMQH